MSAGAQNLRELRDRPFELLRELERRGRAVAGQVGRVDPNRAAVRHIHQRVDPAEPWRAHPLDEIFSIGDARTALRVLQPRKFQGVTEEGAVNVELAERAFRGTPLPSDQDSRSLTGQVDHRGGGEP